MTLKPQEILEPFCYAHSATVAYREVAGEVLLVPIRTDVKEPSGIYTLNRTASFLWKSIDGIQTVGALSQAVQAQFDVSFVQAMADTQIFIADLLSFGAIVAVESS